MTEVIPQAEPQSMMNGAISTGTKANMRAEIQPDSGPTTGTGHTMRVILQDLRRVAGPMTPQSLSQDSKGEAGNKTTNKMTINGTTKDLTKTTLNRTKTKSIGAVLMSHPTDLKGLNNPALPKRPSSLG